ncbi:MAG: site-specific DNA-methyltransferase, partial [Bacteroidales bacterium]
MENDYTNKSNEELLLKIRELEKEDKKLNTQIIKDDRYGLNWIDCPEAFEKETEDKIPILEEAKDKAITNEDGKPTHILIEGDNYHALTCLNYTHKGKIDVIYIDPPYNTGSDGFTYKDKRFLKEYPNGQPVPKEHPLRHSYWLSFMSKRLQLAKELLSDKGVIFISIDDNEIAQLKLLCDKVFGDDNIIAQMIWQQGKKHIGTFIGVNHEYMIVYAKNKSYINDNTRKWRQRKEGLDKIYTIYDKLRKKYKSNNQIIEEEMNQFFNSLPENDVAYSSKHYSHVDDKGLFFAADISQGTGKGPKYDVFHPLTNKPVTIPSGGWRYSFETMQKLLKDDRIFFGDDETKVPCRKRYLKETEYELPSSVFYKDGRGATKEVETTLGKKIF